MVQLRAETFRWTHRAAADDSPLRVTLLDLTPPPKASLCAGEGYTSHILAKTKPNTEPNTGLF